MQELPPRTSPSNTFPLPLRLGLILLLVLTLLLLTLRTLRIAKGEITRPLIRARSLGYPALFAPKDRDPHAETEQDGAENEPCTEPKRPPPRDLGVQVESRESVIARRDEQSRVRVRILA